MHKRGVNTAAVRAFAACVLVAGLASAESLNAQPEARMAATLAFDRDRGVAVLFGGHDGGLTQFHGDTWAYDAGRWCLRSTLGPPAWAPYGSAYDTRAGAVFIYIAGSGTWAWHGSAWSLRSSQDLRTSFGAAMTYDERRGVLVQHGGWPTYPNPNWSETWEWNGQAWRLVSDQGPSNQWYTALTYDSARGVCVGFGDDGPSGRTAEWDGWTWRRLTIPGPAPRATTSLAYDAWRGVTVLFGGQRPDFPTSVLFGDTWEYDGQVWRARATPGPSPRFGHGMTFDSTRGVSILFGGLTAEGVSNETWEWDGDSWTLIESACDPDCDTTTGQRILDIFDFLCFQNRYAAGAPYACDCDTSSGQGVCDVFDFLCFQNAYAAGCP